MPTGFSLLTPFPTTIPALGNATFEIQCDAASVSTFSGTLQFTTNDADENPFDFPISCTVTATPVPEIEVRDGVTDIPDGTLTPVDFGSTTQTVPISRIFTVNNVGSADLTLANLTLPTGFSLIGTLPAFVPASGSETFEVQCDANTVNTFSGTLQFDTNDADENPFDFPIRCTVTAPPADLPPFVTGIMPVDGAVNVPVSTLIAVDFSEAVTVGTISFDLTCTASGTNLPFNLIGTGMNYTLDPASNLIEGETCTLTVFAVQVTDLDGVPDHMVADFVSTFTVVNPTTPDDTGGQNNDTGQTSEDSQPRVLIASDFIIKTVDKPLAQIGETVTYTITFRNPTDKAMGNATLQDEFDPRLEAITLVSTTIGSATLEGNRLTISGITLAVGEQVQIIVTARISGRAKAGDVIPNVATLSYNPTYISNNAPVTILPNKLPATGEVSSSRRSLLGLLLIMVLLITVFLQFLLKAGRHRWPAHPDKR